MSVPVVAFFNNKGGVGKTSLVFHLSWMYARIGLRVLACDLDPQSNLTAAFLDEDALATLWLDEESESASTIFGCVKPLIERTGDINTLILQNIDTRLALIAGDLRLSNFEQQLSDEWANTILGDVAGLRVTSAFWRVIQKGVEQHQADIVLVDMGPNLGAINRAVMIASDYIVLPLAADLFSLQGLRNLGPTLRRWREEWQKNALEKRKDNRKLMLPSGNMLPIGYIIMQHGERKDRVVKAYNQWIERIPFVYENDVLVGERTHSSAPAQIGSVRYYYSLMAMAHEARKPIFELRPADGAAGSHFKTVGKAYDNFNQLALSIAERIKVSIPEVAS